MIFHLLVSFVLSEITQPVEKTIVKGGDDGSKFYRIPAITFAPDNKTLVTATDKRWYNNGDLPGKIDVIIKISKDNGVTWSDAKMITPGLSDPNGYGDPLLIVDHYKKAIFCMFSGNKGTFGSTKDDRQRNYYCVSYDNGETWSPMVDITNMLYGTGCPDKVRMNYSSNFLTSGNGLQMRNGRLILVGVVRKDTSNTLVPCTVYSDDHGKTWTMSPYSPLTTGGDESKVVELNNGSLIMAIRRNPRRLFALSVDGGEHWGYAAARPELVEPACNGDIIRYTSTKDGYDKDRLLLTLPYSNNGRVNMTVLISYDEGNTWPVSKSIYAGSSAYSSITFSPVDGKIYLYWEKGAASGSGYDMVVTTLTLDYLTDGKDTWKPPK